MRVVGFGLAACWITHEQRHDQVKCSHGSTSGQISDEEIFYLQARGIPAREARQMISQGFLNEAIERLSGQELKETIQQRFEERFALLA